MIVSSVVRRFYDAWGFGGNVLIQLGFAMSNMLAWNYRPQLWLLFFTWQFLVRCHLLDDSKQIFHPESFKPSETSQASFPRSVPTFTSDFFHSSYPSGRMTP